MTRRRKVLLIEDDRDDQLIFCSALDETREEVDCIVANNGKEATLNLKTMHPLPVMIFLDLNMPLMNGYEFLIELRRQSVYRDIPVIVFTTTFSNEEKQRCVDLGVQSFFIKPSDPLELKQKLGTLLKESFRRAS